MKKIMSIIAAIAAFSITSLCVAAETAEAITTEAENEVIILSETMESVSTAEVEDTTVVVGDESVDTVTENEPVVDPSATLVAEYSGEKGSPDTGVAGVAGLAGVAILAAGTLLVSRKR